MAAMALDAIHSTEQRYVLPLLVVDPQAGDREAQPDEVVRLMVTHRRPVVIGSFRQAYQVLVLVGYSREAALSRCLFAASGELL